MLKEIFNIKEDHPATADEAGIQEVLSRWKELLVKNGINVGQKLGAGSYGVAFDIGSNQVLKVTGDVKEAVASNKLIGKNYKHLVKVFKVFKFPEQDGMWRGIVLEKLTPMSNGEKREWQRADSVIDKYFSNGLYSVFGKTWKEWTAIVREKAESVSEEALEELEEALEDLEAFKLDEILDELKSAGISFGDFHTGNLMKRQREYVITDLGQSLTAGGKHPPVLEKIKEN